MPPKRPQLDDDVRLMDGRRGIVAGIDGDTFAVLTGNPPAVVLVPLKDIAGVIHPGFRVIDR